MCFTRFFTCRVKNKSFLTANSIDISQGDMVYLCAPIDWDFELLGTLLDTHFLGILYSNFVMGSEIGVESSVLVLLICSDLLKLSYHKNHRRIKRYSTDIEHTLNSKILYRYNLSNHVFTPPPICSIRNADHSCACFPAVID